MYIVQGDKILMDKDERDTYWLPYTWYHKQTDSSPMSALKHALQNMQVSVNDTKLKNLGTSEHAGNKYVEYATHFR